MSRRLWVLTVDIVLSPVDRIGVRKVVTWVQKRIYDSDSDGLAVVLGGTRAKTIQV